MDKKMAEIIFVILVFLVGFIFFIAMFGETLGIGTIFTKMWCYGYCAMKITNPLWGGAIPGGFCGC